MLSEPTRPDEITPVDVLELVERSWIAPRFPSADERVRLAEAIAEIASRASLDLATIASVFPPVDIVTDPPAPVILGNARTALSEDLT